MNNVVKLVSELEIQNDNVYFLFIIQSRDQAWWKKNVLSPLSKDWKMNWNSGPKKTTSY